MTAEAVFDACFDDSEADAMISDIEGAGGFIISPPHCEGLLISRWRSWKDITTVFPFGFPFIFGICLVDVLFCFDFCWLAIISSNADGDGEVGRIFESVQLATGDLFFCCWILCCSCCCFASIDDTTFWSSIIEFIDGL